MQKNAKIDTDTLLDLHNHTFDEQQLDKRDEEELNSVVFKTSTNYVKRISDLQPEEPPLKKIKENSSVPAIEESKPNIANISFLPRPKETKVEKRPLVAIKPKIAVVVKSQKKEEPALSLVDY